MSIRACGSALLAECSVITVHSLRSAVPHSSQGIREIHRLLQTSWSVHRRISPLAGSRGDCHVAHAGGRVGEAAVRRAHRWRRRPLLLGPPRRELRHQRPCSTRDTRLTPLEREWGQGRGRRAQLRLGRPWRRWGNRTLLVSQIRSFHCQPLSRHSCPVSKSFRVLCW